MPDTRSMQHKKIEKLWYDSFESIEKIVDRITHETIIKNIQPEVLDPENLQLKVQKQWQKDCLSKFVEPISDILSEKNGGKINIALIVEKGKNGEASMAVIEEKFPKNEKKRPVNDSISNDDNYDSGEIPIVESENILDPRYTFDNFIIGSGNRFAAAAAQAVAKEPAKAYNPLFIYGGVGLGKTHLITAIGNMVLGNKHDAKVVYVSAEKFTNDMIESLGDKKMKQFRRKYRNVDVLLLDDIQFIKNKEAIQEEFFHTFNELHGAKAQIVITSDRPPKDIPTLEDRLRSRFEWGLIADISQPDLETRMAILKKKADEEKIAVSNDVISYIAEMVPSNIRELEGALNRVICYASLMKNPIDIGVTVTALKSIIPDSRPKHITINLIQEKVCEYYNLRIEEILGKCRDNRLVIPRQIAMFLSKDILAESFPNIGKAFGGRDHTTVMHACKKIEKIRRDPSIKNDMENIRNLLKTTGG